MSVKHALLGLLAEAPRHGYDLKRAFDEKFGAFWHLNYGQIYTTLERLQDEGFVAFDTVPQYDRPDKKVYCLTTAGRDEFHAWRTRPLKAEPRSLRDELFMKLMFMDGDNMAALLTLIEAKQNVYQAQMMRLTNRKFHLEQSIRRGSHLHDEGERRRLEREHWMQSVLIDAALMHVDADLQWLRHLSRKLEEIAASR